MGVNVDERQARGDSGALHKGDYLGISPISDKRSCKLGRLLGRSSDVK